MLAENCDIFLLKVVHGEVFEADKERLKWLEYFEDIGVMYGITSIKVVLEDTLREENCLCYVMFEKHSCGISYENTLSFYSIEDAQTYNTNF